MADNNPHHMPEDRRLQTRVYDLEAKLQALLTKDATRDVEIATLKGEISGLRATAATSFEVKSAGDLIRAEVKGQFGETNSRLEHLHRDLGTIKTIGWSFIFVVVAGFIGSLGAMVYRS